MRALAVAIVASVVLGLFAHAANAAPKMLFPGAASVRVYGAPTAFNVVVDHEGRVTATGPSKDNSGAEEYPVKDGGLLSPVEASKLKAAVRFTRPPDVIFRCCVPRHAFLFYDRSGRYLGYLKVCFECTCAEMEPFHPPNPARNWISWNYENVKQIVIAHGLGPIAQRR